MPEATPPETVTPAKKRSPAIVATITMHALGKTTDPDYIDKAVEMRARMTAAISAITEGAPEWLVVTQDKPKPGKVVG